jgi:hypothetical protein
MVRFFMLENAQSVMIDIPKRIQSDVKGRFERIDGRVEGIEVARRLLAV